jgi:hypothetical protein
MKEFKNTHMPREDRVETAVQLGHAKIRLRNAELGIKYANEQVAIYKVAEQEQAAFERAEQLLRKSSDSSKTSLSPRSSSRELSVTNPLGQPINNITQANEQVAFELDRARVHREAANHLLQDKLTPTAFVGDCKRESSEIGKKHAELTKEHQRIDNFLSGHSHPHYRLTGGRQEKE